LARLIVENRRRPKLSRPHLNKSCYLDSGAARGSPFGPASPAPVLARATYRPIHCTRRVFARTAHPPAPARVDFPKQRTRGRRTAFPRRSYHVHSLFGRAPLNLGECIFLPRPSTMFSGGVIRTLLPPPCAGRGNAQSPWPAQL
jgi:hypothetical protein